MGRIRSSFWVKEFRIALRTLKNRPLFTSSAIVILALGIGINLSIMAFVKAALFDPPSFGDPQELVLLHLTSGYPARGGTPRPHLWTFPQFEELERGGQAGAEAVAAYATFEFTRTGGEHGEVAQGEVVTRDYHRVLGAGPEMGRTFSEGDERGDADPVAIVAYSYWQEKLGGDPSAVGSSIEINKRPVTVIGIAPRGFRGLSGQAQFWVPIPAAEDLLRRPIQGNASGYWFSVVGRLGPEQEVEPVAERMKAFGMAVEREEATPDPDAVYGGSARQLLESRVTPQTRLSLLLLNGAGGLVLLVACANLAILLLARVAERRHDTAVRLALGGSRARIAWGTLAEALVLSQIGCVAALKVASVGIDLLAEFMPAVFMRAGWNLSLFDPGQVELNGQLVLMSVGLALLAGLIVGILPALQATKMVPAQVLRGERVVKKGLSVTTDPRDLVVAGQVAVAMILILGASLLFRSLEHLQGVDGGVDPGGVVVANFSIPPGTAWSGNEGEFRDLLLERLRENPTVEAAAVACTPPHDGHCRFGQIAGAGSTVFERGSRPTVGIQYVRGDFFESVSAPLIAGRPFSSQSGSTTTAEEVVLSELAAARLFPAGDAVGQRVRLEEGILGDGESATVIGVAGDILYDLPTQGVTPDIYVNLPESGFGETLIVRSSASVATVLPDLRRLVADIDPDVPVFNARTLEEIRSDQIGDTRLLRNLLGLFSIVSLILGCAGVWAITANRVAQRKPEIGIRMALGANARSVVGEVQGKGLFWATVGLFVGLGSALFLARLIRSTLFGISPFDPTTIAGGSLLLLSVTWASAYLPAREATRVNPVVVLKSE
jgi:predicted permease